MSEAPKHPIYEGMPELTECRPSRRRPIAVRIHRVLVWAGLVVGIVCLVALLLLVLVGGLSPQAKAQELSPEDTDTLYLITSCFQGDAYTAWLAQRYGMHITSSGTAVDGSRVVFFLNPESLDWAIAVELETGDLCVSLGGDHWGGPVLQPGEGA